MYLEESHQQSQRIKLSYPNTFLPIHSSPSTGPNSVIPKRPTHFYLMLNGSIVGDEFWTRILNMILKHLLRIRSLLTV